MTPSTGGASLPPNGAELQNGGQFGCWRSWLAWGMHRALYGPRLGGGDSDLVGRMVMAANYVAATSYGSTTAVVIERSLGVFGSIFAG